MIPALPTPPSGEAVGAAERNPRTSILAGGAPQDLRVQALVEPPPGPDCHLGNGASQGQLQVSKLSPKSFSLKIFSVGPENEGAYRCVVAEVTRAQMGSWQVLQKKQSPDSFVRLWKQAGM